MTDRRRQPADATSDDPDATIDMVPIKIPPAMTDPFATGNPALTLRPATIDDCETILTFIMALAEYERLASEVVADVPALQATLFGPRPGAEVILAELDGAPVGFALFFTSYSTFLGRPGLYLEDLFVDPLARGRGVGHALMLALARTAVMRGYGRFEWSVLDWNEPALEFYRRLGAIAMAGWTVHRLSGAALYALAAGDAGR